MNILAEFFVQKHWDDRFHKWPKISTETKVKMMSYYWPGNVRQLENAIIYALNVLDSDIILSRHLPDEVIQNESGQLGAENQTLVGPNYSDKGNLFLGMETLSHVVSLKEAERIVINNALVKACNNIALAAEFLEVSKSTLYRKLKMLG